MSISSEKNFSLYGLGKSPLNASGGPDEGAVRTASGQARILCFDDNGYYIFPSLLILEHMMSHAGNLTNGKEARPCQYFDLICGSGLGGIIAIMLGRLGMTIGQCQQWFKEHCDNMLPIGRAGMIVGSGRKLQRNNQALEKCVKAAIVTAGFSENIEFIDSNHTGVNSSVSGPQTTTCRVFVLAMHPGDIHIPIRLRSYSSRMDPIPTACQTWEAAVATEASPAYYAPITIGEPPLPCISSALGYCNPAKEALDEAVRIWQLSGIRCVVSLGTAKKPPRLELGAIPTKSIGLFQLKKALGLVNTLSAIATDTQRVQAEMVRDMKLLGLKYFRFEGDEGVTYKDSYNRSFLAKVQASVVRYLQSEEASKTLAFCAQHLQYDGILGSMPDHRDKMDLSKGLIELSIDASRHQHQSSVSSTTDVGRANLGSPILDSECIPPIKEKEHAELSADQWLQRLRDKVHPLVEQRRRENDRRVKIAILDSGLDQEHPDIIRLTTKLGDGRIKELKDWTSSEAGTADQTGHGTFCAALFLTVAPNADIYVAKTFDSPFAVPDTPERVAEALTHAATVWNVDIVTMAFGFQQRHDSILKAVRMAYDRGVIMLAAASNDGAVESKPAFPARLDQVISIYSADGYGTSSVFNPLPSIAEDNFTILGEKVESAELGSQRIRKSGTSVATMIAAGVAALVLELSFQRPARMREADVRSYSGMRALFTAMARDIATFTPDGRYFIRPWKLLDPEKDLDFVLMDISYILDQL